MQLQIMNHEKAFAIYIINVTGQFLRQCYFRSAFLDTEVNKIATSHKLGHEIYLCAMNLLMENELLLQDDKNQGTQGLLIEI